MENIPPSNQVELPQLQVVSAQELHTRTKWMVAKASSVSDLCNNCRVSFGNVVTWQGSSLTDIFVEVRTMIESVEVQLASSKEELATQQKGYEALLATQQKGYEAQLATQQKGYEAQLAIQQKGYEAQLATQQKGYEAQLDTCKEELATQRKDYGDLLKRQEDSFQKQLDSWIDEKNEQLSNNTLVQSIATVEQMHRQTIKDAVRRIATVIDCDALETGILNEEESLLKLVEGQIDRMKADSYSLNEMIDLLDSVHGPSSLADLLDSTKKRAV
eukprot:gene9409-6739_t